MLGMLGLFHFHVTSSLRHRRILTSVSNVCGEALMSLFWAARLYLLLYVPQKKKHTKKTGTYAGYSTPWSCVSLAINLTAYISASLLFILRYLPSSEAFTVIHFRSVLETKRRRVHGGK